MKYLTAFILVLLSILKSECTFTLTPTTTFKIAGYPTGNKSLLVSDSGKEFIVWDKQAQIIMASTNGTTLCSKTFNANLTGLVWPSTYPLLVRLKDTGDIVAVDDKCEIDRTWERKTFAKNITDSLGAFTYGERESRKVLVITGLKAIYELDLETSEITASYPYTSGSIFEAVVLSDYSKSGNTLFTVSLDLMKSSTVVRVWDTNQTGSQPAHTFDYPNATLFSVFYPSRDGQSVFFSTVDMFQPIGSIVYRVNSTSTSVALKSDEPVIGLITDTDKFDSALSVLVGFSVINLDDGKKIQTVVPPGDFQNAEAFHYAGRSLVFVNESGTVLVYKYKNDDSEPNPDPDDGESGSNTTVWIIVGSVVGVALIVGVVGVVIYRKKKAALGKYGKLADEK